MFNARVLVETISSKVQLYVELSNNDVISLLEDAASDTSLEALSLSELQGKSLVLSTRWTDRCTFVSL